ncbi:hypothetical protein BpHYR1_023267 [Brachionus plicatilis]|uniref:Uncharacterized protein n=1 Tax=Brachionus plicatilis TaxID=10195 RepID=A0A3M7QVD0_BRAPC|nr:hypothetical protein BpHYR1_023267 [Brachionus plicatilis]
MTLIIIIGKNTGDKDDDNQDVFKDKALFKSLRSYYVPRLHRKIEISEKSIKYQLEKNKQKKFDHVIMIMNFKFPFTPEFSIAFIFYLTEFTLAIYRKNKFFRKQLIDMSLKE